MKYFSDQMIFTWSNRYIFSLAKIKLILSNQMGYISSVQEQIGLAYSIVGLVLVVPTVFIFKQYNRFLDHLQIIYLFSILLGPSYETFGSHLEQSWAKFIPNFLKFCTEGDLVCQLGFALSWTICLIGVIGLLFLIVTFLKCKKPDLRFEPIYSFFKGFFKWTYLPLVSYSLTYLIIDLKYETQTNLIPSIIILVWTILFPIIQLIGYKIIQLQKDNIWIKWFQFFGYLRQFLVVLLLILNQLVETNTNIAKYFVYGALILYSAIYLWKGVYMYRVLERIFFALQEAIIITIFSHYLFGLNHLVDYQLDFIGLSVILFLHLVSLTIKLIGRLVYGRTDEAKISSEVHPQQIQERNKNNESYQVMDIGKDFSPKKKNKYDEPDDLLGSRQSLANSIRRGNERRRR